MARILLVDDHQILMDGVAELLRRSENYEVFETAGSAKQALKILITHADTIDLVITDIKLPDERGTTLAKEIKELSSSIKVIALSMHHERHIVKAAIKAGVDGYVVKSGAHDELLMAISQVLRGENYLSPAITGILMDELKNPPVINTLSEREIEIIRLISQEFTTKKIAETLFISEKTVEAHKTNIFRKTRTNTLVGLTKFAFENNLILAG